MSWLKLDWWVIWGLIAQALFTARFLVQWLASEKARKSIIPNSFWILSVGGSGMLLAYAIIRADPVFILGQSFGSIVYLRNLRLIDKENPDQSKDTITTQNRKLLPLGLAIMLLIAVTATAIIAYSPDMHPSGQQFALVSSKPLSESQAAEFLSQGNMQQFFITEPLAENSAELTILSAYPVTVKISNGNLQITITKVPTPQPMRYHFSKM